MKRCTYCFRYSRRQTPYCTTCGRTFNVRICSRGHSNTRGVEFCAECGSADLSTPAPPAGLLFTLSGWALRILIVSVIGIVILSAALGLIHTVDWNAIAPHLGMLILVFGFLYWTTTLLPGPIKKVGHIAARHAAKTLTNKRRSH